MRLLLALMVSYLFGFTHAVEQTTEKTVLRLGCVDFPPYTSIDKEGNISGIFIELARKQFKEIGIEVQCIELPAMRLFTYLSKGKIDCFVGIKEHPMLTNTVLVSKELTGQINMNMYYRHSGNTQTYKVISDVKNLRIGAMLGYSYGNQLQHFKQKALNNSIQEVTDRTSAYNMLKLGRIDAMLDYTGPSKRYRTELKDMAIQAMPIMQLDCYYVFNKDVKDAQLILSKLDKLLAIRNAKQKK